MSKRHVSLKNWKQKLRDYQEEAVAEALSVPQGGKLLLSSPTGTGKGTMELGLLKACRKKGLRTWIVTPSIEVLRGYLERCGATAKDLDRGSAHLISLGKKIFVTTPVRLRNRLRGQIRKRGGKRYRVTQKTPDVLIIDEAHHATFETIAGGGLQKYCPNATMLGFTATAFRSNPEETAELQKSWPTIHTVLTIPEAIERGAWALPKWRVEPLINDDDCEIVRGDIDADEATLLAIRPIADLVQRLDLSVPTAVTITTVKAAKELNEELLRRNVVSRIVLSTTPTAERAESYHIVKAGGAVLISVRVLGEGVDLPWLRRWVDASPTLSPVAFLQKLGRITRVGDKQPEYVGTNRNLERHGYLLKGALPRAEIREIQKKMGGGSRRGARAGLMKGVSRLKPIVLPLAGGIEGTMWALWQPSLNGGPGFERCILIDPTSEREISARRELFPEKERAEKFGPWVQEKRLPKKIVGFKATRLTGMPTLKQEKYWIAEAANRGLNPSVEKLTRAQFFALPVLKDLKTSMAPDGKTLRPEKEDRVKEQDTDPVAQEALTAPAIADGYYTVVLPDGGHRTYRLHTQGKDKKFFPGRQILALLNGPENTTNYYQSCAFVDGQKLTVWRKFDSSKEAITQRFAAIIGDTEAAGKLYALKSGRCWKCARLLTTPESIQNGMGPECYGRAHEKLELPWSEHYRTEGELDAEKYRQETEEGEPERDSLSPEQRKKHVTSNESNIPLMKRMIREGIAMHEIDRIYRERYALEGKTDLRWVNKRVDTYRKIAQDQIRTENYQKGVS